MKFIEVMPGFLINLPDGEPQVEVPPARLNGVRRDPGGDQPLQLPHDTDAAGVLSHPDDGPIHFLNRGPVGAAALDHAARNALELEIDVSRVVPDFDSLRAEQ